MATTQVTYKCFKRSPNNSFEEANPTDNANRLVDLLRTQDDTAAVTSTAPPWQQNDLLHYHLRNVVTALDAAGTNDTGMRVDLTRRYESIWNPITKKWVPIDDGGSLHFPLVLATETATPETPAAFYLQISCN